MIPGGHGKLLNRRGHHLGAEFGLQKEESGRCVQDGLETNKTSSEARTITRQQNERVESWERIENPGGQRAQNLEDQNCEGERHCPGGEVLKSALQKGLQEKGHLLQN